MYLANHPCLFELVSDNNIGPVDVIPDDVSAYNSPDDRSCVHSDSHVETAKFYLLPFNLVDHLDHFKGKVNHIFSLLFGVTVVTIGKPKHHITVSDCVQLVNVVLGAQNVKLLEQTPQHTDHILWLLPILGSVRKLGKSLYVRKKYRAILEHIRQL